MSEPKPIILKIGGSVITDKNRELLVKTKEINRLAGEIQKASVQNLIIVHGGGSFGHPPAKRYAIKSGLKEGSQKIGFSETHHFMTLLNGLFVDSLILCNIPAITITPSSCLMAANGRIKRFEDTQLKTFLKMGFLPVLYGDAVLDKKVGFTIISGDQLVSMLAVRLNAGRIIMGVDVDGLYDADPKTEKNPKLYTHLTLEELRKLRSNLGKSVAIDVTGGMFGKITELISALEHGIPVTIVNATKPNYIYSCLRQEKVKCTLLEKG